MWEHHEITLSNFVLGEARLLRLPLPRGWRLKRGFSPPELYAVHRRREVPWVASAYLHYLLESLDGRYLVEFTIRVGPQAHRLAEKGQEMRVNQHPARLVRRTVRRGPPWARRDTPHWQLAWHCPHTERYLLLELVGRVPEEMLEELVRGWSFVVCH